MTQYNTVFTATLIIKLFDLLRRVTRSSSVHILSRTLWFKIFLCKPV